MKHNKYVIEKSNTTGNYTLVVWTDDLESANKIMDKLTMSQDYYIYRMRSPNGYIIRTLDLRLHDMNFLLPEYLKSIINNAKLKHGPDFVNEFMVNCIRESLRHGLHGSNDWLNDFISNNQDSLANDTHT